MADPVPPPLPPPIPGRAGRSTRAHEAPGPGPAETLARLLGQLPPLPDVPGMSAASRTELFRRLKDLVRDSGRELKRLRRLPRDETAGIARFRAVCRDLLAGCRGLDRAGARLQAARRRIASLEGRSERGQGLE